MAGKKSRNKRQSTTLVDQLNLKGLGKALRSELGRSIEKERQVRLGDRNNVVFVPSSQADNKDLVFFRELPGQTTFEGQAILTGGTLARADLIPENRVRIKRDDIHDEWVVMRPDPIFASEFSDGVSIMSSPDPIQMGQLLVGLLDQTEPASMAARVVSTPYWLDGLLKYWDLQITKDFTSDVPSNPAIGLYSLVQINHATGVLSYKLGTTEVAELLTHAQAFSTDVDGDVFPQPDAGNFATGYVRLNTGMSSSLRGTNVWNVQEMLSKRTEAVGLRKQPRSLSTALVIENDEQYVMHDLTINAGGSVTINAGGILHFA